MSTTDFAIVEDHKCCGGKGGEACCHSEACQHAPAPTGEPAVTVPAADPSRTPRIQRQQPRSIDEKDVRRLNTNGYEQKSKKFNTAFVMMHNKTGKLAELWAASSVHACTMLHWNPKHTTLLRTRTRDVEKPAEVKPEAKTGPAEESIVVPVTPVVGEFIPGRSVESVSSK